MELKELQLTVIPEGWRLFNLRKTDPAFLKFSKQILKRDDYSCQFCGFKSSQHQEVVNLNKDYYNNKTDNLATACCFCAQCFFLEAVGKSEYGGGTLIYLPELSQTEINGFCHSLFMSITADDNCSDDAQSIYRTLKLRSKIVEKELGEGSSNPALVGQILIDYPLKKASKTCDKLLQQLRLLPSREKFSKQLTDWSQEAGSEIIN